ncbi:MAG: type II toxin-antitoxin system RelE/ParE family toxin [Gammaproteobacteria bacterium]|nr:type II toxin-antitoxin system RelE/ParE family toxin [Gammaproteobacteria bacterium]TVQ50451.1 MAG: type II toxin-antitoxin system RelE/ParE family toxin [Gammaproteobacteria bacterium]
MKRARFISAARREFLEQVAFYNSESRGLGERFSNAIEEAAARAAAFPQSGSPAAGGTRQVLVRGFPFSLVYRLDEEEIVIFAVVHQARRPERWIARLPDR